MATGMFSVLLCALLASIARGDVTSLLLAFKHGLSDPRGALGSWNASNTMCTQWRGVQCTPQGQLAALHLDSMGLAASRPLSSELTSLLQSISMANNELNGTILGHLSFSTTCSLRRINLSSNHLKGSVPLANLLLNCTKLESLDLSGNDLSSVSGSPAQSALRKLNLSSNSLTRSPEFTGGWGAKLITIDISDNLILGTVFSSHHNGFPFLKVLNLSKNKFQGDLQRLLGTASYAASFPSLEFLDASYNRVQGQVPSIATNLTKLLQLDLSSNELSGALSPLCSPTSRLNTLLLANNQISGSLGLVMNCSNLTRLVLSLNSLRGPIPSDICKRMPQLAHLMAWGNAIDGEIPVSIGSDCRHLQTLVLNSNRLSGTIPSSLGECTELVWLTLSDNNLSGRIPPSLGLLNKLFVLELSNNSLEGTIPGSIATNCRNLLWLDLSINKLGGMVPSLAQNTRSYFGGTGDLRFWLALSVNAGVEYKGPRHTRPPCKGAAGMVAIVGIPEDRLHAEPCSGQLYKVSTFNMSISMTRGQDLRSPIGVDLSYNNLEGSIPDEFTSMVDLVVLDLAHNRLDGNIPPSLGSAESFQILDLSNNRLQGRVPSELCKLSGLSSFDVSNNELFGAIPSCGQLSTFDPSVYEGNDLCGPPLETKCALTGAHATIPDSVEPNHEHLWSWLAFSVSCAVTTVIGIWIGWLGVAKVFLPYCTQSPHSAYLAAVY